MFASDMLIKTRTGSLTGDQEKVKMKGKAKVKVKLKGS